MNTVSIRRAKRRTACRAAAAGLLVVMLGTGMALAATGAPDPEAPSRQAASRAKAAGTPPAARYGAQDTPGWTEMSIGERSAYRRQVESLKTYRECKDFMRTQERRRPASGASWRTQGGAPAPADVCDSLPNR